MPMITAIYFSAASMIIVIPSGIQLFAWITTIVTGRPRFRTPLMWIIGFIVLFIIGGLSGVMFAAIPFDQQTTDTYFVVAHFHFVIFGAAVFPILGGIYFWFPKVTGRMYHEGAGQLSFWLTFAGTLITFFPMHILGLEGMPRRNYTYPPGLGWTALNLIESLGSYLLTAGLLIMVANLVWSRFRGAPAGDNPFEAPTLEWGTSSPPPAYNFAVIPTVTSPYAMWDPQDREEDRERLARGVLTLEQGHETLATTALDGEIDEVLDMPSDSPFPILLAGALTLVFVMLLTGHWTTALVFFALVAIVLGAWHLKEPQEA
jgi:cytochrome c oxidase subunit 1/cytochrome c oxidase subunit I+III